MYTSPTPYQGSEDDFSETLVKPYIDAVTRNSRPETCKTESLKGQPIFGSMTSQLRQQSVFVDLKSQYKSDGLLKLFGSKEIKLLLVELLGCYGNTNMSKLRFDHHKRIFGVVACLSLLQMFTQTHQLKLSKK